MLRSRPSAAFRTRSASRAAAMPHSTCRIGSVGALSPAIPWAPTAMAEPSICFQDGEDLNGMMVRDGHAVAYRQYSRRYVSEEDDARSARRGIWATEFDLPYDWRRNH